MLTHRTAPHCELAARVLTSDGDTGVPQDNLMEFVQVGGTADSTQESCNGRVNDFKGRLVLVRKKSKHGGTDIYTWQLCT